MKHLILKRYKCKSKTCALCGEPFSIGDCIIKTATKYYHESCFLKLLH
ncbi:MAG: hypothetical protein QXX34_06190 [Candidatus Bathyarchaeia archaeon]